MPQKNRWHPVMLPDDYLRRMKQDLSEVEAQVESKTIRELVTNAQPAVGCGDGLPITGGFASLQPEDADYAVEVCRQQDSIVHCRVQLRLEPEHYVVPKRARRDG